MSTDTSIFFLQYNTCQYIKNVIDTNIAPSSIKTKFCHVIKFDQSN